ncbi:lytic polysaccharide monooxygenase [Streptomyces sp.]|uniref:lytic polysaccharide monooxygenase n=1 Tax=Streptomyces sp. TaxID=1931 RepID=UPI002F402464
MSGKTEIAAPRDLRAAATYRTDGGEKLYGISLEWTIGENNGAGRPGDWESGTAGGYPRLYEVELNDGELRQTVAVGFHALPTWGSYWNLARTHWVSLGTDPDARYEVKVRARQADGWSPWTNTVTVDAKDAVAYVNPYSESGAPAAAEEIAPMHGSVSRPVSRALYALPLNDPSPMCAAARERITAPGDWAGIVPPGTVENPPWNGQYLEYRKFFAGRGPVIASANRTEFAGLDLTPSQVGGADWPTTTIGASADELVLQYGYTAFHRGWTWTHQWFVTVDGWQPDQGISWETLEPFPFFVDLYGGPGEHSEGTPWEETETHVIQTVPRKSGRHAFVNIYGGHGGHSGKGEFFVSVCDVVFA